MTSLHDQLGDLVADTTTDLDRLATRSRQRGLAQRRQRRALTTVGAAAVVAVLAVSGFSLESQDPPTPVATDDTSPPTATNASPSTAPGSTQTRKSVEANVRLTGQSTAGLLLELLDSVVPASIVKGSVQGQGGVRLLHTDGTQALAAAENEDTYAEATVFTQTGRSRLGVNVQHASMSSPPLESGTCPGYPGGCTITELPNGDTLRTYTDDSDKPGIVRLVAELVSLARDLRIVVAASTPTGDPSAVNLDQLSTIASSPRWSRQVPDSLTTAGQRFGFTSLDVTDRLHPVDP